MLNEVEFLDELFPQHEMEGNFRTRLLSILRQDPEFPTFPTALSKLQSYLSHPDIGFDKIAELIKLDAGITARVLTLVQSAAYAGVTVSTVEEALWRLGLKETRAVVLTRKFMIPFSKLKVEIDWSKFWFHSLLVARLTYNIYDNFQPVLEKEYLAGLLHDTGKLILAHYFPDKFQAIMEEGKKSSDEMHQIERRVIGTDHGAITTALCYKWELNRDIVQAISLYHNPERIGSNQLLPRCLNVANRLANQYADNIDNKDRLPPPEDITTTPEWNDLKEFTPRRMVTLSIKEECNKARETADAMLKEPTATGPTLF